MQVLANLAAAALSSVCFQCHRKSRVAGRDRRRSRRSRDRHRGQRNRTIRGAYARLITSWKRVPAGTDGGITRSGSVAGLAAGLGIAAVAAVGGLIPWSQMWIPVCAGFGGMLLDSLLGATLQRRNWIDNQTVNLISTLAAAALAYAVLVLE